MHGSGDLGGTHSDNSPSQEGHHSDPHHGEEIHGGESGPDGPHKLDLDN